MAGGLFGHDADIPVSPDGRPVVPKAFPYESFDPVTSGCIGHFFGHRNPQPGAAGCACLKKRKKMGAVDFFSGSG